MIGRRPGLTLDQRNMVIGMLVPGMRNKEVGWSEYNISSKYQIPSNGQCKRSSTYHVRRQGERTITLRRHPDVIDV